MTHQNPRTAPSTKSIWTPITETIFRTHLVALEERTNAVPIDPEIFDISSWPLAATPQNYTLPIAIEQQLADDFARLVAVDEGAQSVAAVCVEERINSSDLTLRFAALDIERNGAVEKTLHLASEILKEVAVKTTRKDVFDPGEYSAQLLGHIVNLHFARILARLRSTKWLKPKYLSKTHKKPLWQDFTNLHHRLEHAYLRKEKVLRQQVESCVLALMEVYRSFESVESEAEHEHMIKIIDTSYELVNTEFLKDLTTRLENSVKITPTPQVASAIKCLRQVQKIAGHRRISNFLIETAQRYPQIFQNGIRFEYLTPYANVPTQIGYESWAKTCHVHAEVQLVVHYDLIAQSTTKEKSILPPRCIGISKWLCYLCFRFIEAHGKYFPSKTHGRLYDQWTVPDLVEFEESLVARYRDVLRQVDDVVVRQCEEEVEVWKIEPMTSVDVAHADSRGGNQI